MALIHFYMKHTGHISRTWYKKEYTNNYTIIYIIKKKEIFIFNPTGRPFLLIHEHTFLADIYWYNMIIQNMHISFQSFVMVSNKKIFPQDCDTLTLTNWGLGKKDIRLNSLSPSDAVRYHRSWSTLVKVLACRLAGVNLIRTGAKALSFLFGQSLWQTKYQLKPS